MMELIDRRKLVSDFWKGVEDGAILSYEDTDELMENAPTVDAVELPCKMGDTVWGIMKYNSKQIAKPGVVRQMFFGEDMRLGISVKGVCCGEWGKNIFATKEEVEAAIKKRNGDANG